jgi:hypothetical protein
MPSFFWQETLRYRDDPSFRWQETLRHRNALSSCWQDTLCYRNDLRIDRRKPPLFASFVALALARDPPVLGGIADLTGEIPHLHGMSASVKGRST